MGLLLIERQKWQPRFEDAKAALQEVEDELQAERDAHQQSLLEHKEQDSSLRAALAIEQSCVSNVSSCLFLSGQ